MAQPEPAQDDVVECRDYSRLVLFVMATGYVALFVHRVGLWFAMIGTGWLWALTLGPMLASPYHYAVGPDGLTLRYLLRRPRHVPWSQMRAVSYDVQSAFVELHQGRRIGLFDRRKKVLAAPLEAGLWRWQHGSDRRSAEPERIGELIGLQSGEQFECAPPRAARFWFNPIGCLAGLMLSLLPATIAMFRWLPMDGTQLLVVPYLLLVFVPCAQAITARRQGFGKKVAVDHTGVLCQFDHVQRHLPWSELRQVEPAAKPWILRFFAPVWRIAATNGTVLLSAGYTNAERLLELCRRAVALREEGVSLPATEEVPAGALSRMAGDDASADRGLSQAEE